MKRRIINFHLDELGDWRSQLECGHFQHVRHNPPLIDRTWILTETGRAEHLGLELDCKHCDEELATGSNGDLIFLNEA